MESESSTMPRKPAPDHPSGEPLEDIQITPWFDELAVICIDSSGSMNSDNSASRPGWSKTSEVLSQIFHDKENLVVTLAGGTNGLAYHMAFIAFETEAKVVYRPEPLLEPGTRRIINPPDADLEPYFIHGPNTAIGKALLLAGDIVDGWLGESGAERERFATIVIVSDGEENSDGSVDPVAVAKEIKEKYRSNPVYKKSGEGRTPVRDRITIACAAYGDTANKDLLDDISSGSEFFAAPTSGKELRNFLLKSITFEGVAVAQPVNGSNKISDETQPIA